MTAIRPQVFAQTVGILFNQSISGIENMSERTVILLQFNHIVLCKLTFKITHVLHFRTAKSINRLVIVTHRHHHGLRAGEQLQPRVLQAVGILKLINQNMRKPRLIMRTQRLIGLEHLIRAQQQFRKIDHALALTLHLVSGVNLLHFFVKIILCFDIGRAQTFFFRAVDEILHLFGDEFIRIDLQTFEHAFDGRKLISGVQNLKGLRQIRLTMMRPQKSIAQPMKRANPHAASIHRQQAR